MQAAHPQAQVEGLFEVWATDEHRIGLQPILRKVWALPGQRPVVPVQTRYQWRYLVGFVHPQSGRTFWQTASTVNIDVFTVELTAFAEQAGAGPTREIVLVLDRAGWHTSARVQVPDHVHLTFLPAYSPEVQPAEHWWTLSNAPLVNRHFQDLQELDDVQMAGCDGLQARCDIAATSVRRGQGAHLLSLVAPGCWLITTPYAGLV